MNETVLVRESLAGGVVALRLNRPHVLNALNVAMLEALVEELRACSGARAVLLEAEGRAFCVGEDLQETLAPRGGGADELRRSFELLQEVTRIATSCRVRSSPSSRGTRWEGAQSSLWPPTS